MPNRLNTILIAVLIANLGAQQPVPGPAAQGRIHGRVVDCLQAPIPLAEVWAEVDDTIVARSRSDAEGVFLLSRLPTGPIKVIASAAEHACGFDTILLTPTQPFAWTEVRLLDAAVLTGIISDPSGAPIAGARVSATHAHSMARARSPSVVTDADGRYRFDAVAVGTTIVHAFAASTQVAEQRVHVGQVEQLDFRLAAGPSTTVRFVITGATRSQLERARCTLHAVVEGDPGQVAPDLMLAGRPDEQGTWQVVGLPRQTRLHGCRVTIADAAVTPPVARAPSGQERVELMFTVGATPSVASPPARSPVRGVLVDPQGEPLAGVTIRARGQGGLHTTTALTQADGSFVIESPVPNGARLLLSTGDPALVMHQEKADLRSACREHAEHAVTCAPGLQLRVEAIAAVQLQGRILDPGGQPVFGAEVKLLFPLGEQLPAFHTVRTVHSDRDGHFRIAPLDGTLVRELQLAVTSLAGTSTIAALPLPTSGAHDLGDLRLVPPAVMTGTVTDDAGGVVPGALVVLAHIETAGRLRDYVTIDYTVAGRDGRYRFGSLPPGEYRLIASDRGVGAAGPGFHERRLEAGDAETIDLRLSR